MRVNWVLGLIGLLVSNGWAGTLPPDSLIPPCYDGSEIIPIDNEQVLLWKAATRNQFVARAYVEGTLTQIYPERNSHDHFKIQIGPASTDTLEVVYNQHFGALPELRIGMRVQACGDYITSTEQSGPYPPSPDGAIIHWVHKNPRGRGHESGFVVIDGTLFGWSFAQPSKGKFQFLPEFFAPWGGDEGFAPAAFAQ